MSEQTAMILLASRQCWPNLQSLVHWHRHESPLSWVVILHTDHAEVSQGPAMRLEKVIEESWDSVQVSTLQVPNNPQGVLTAMQTLLDSEPEIEWIINATGGTKLMFAGVLPMVDRSNAEVIYREVDGQWYRFTQTRDGASDVIPFTVNPRETDDIPVVDLIRLQAGETTGGKWRIDSPRRNPSMDAMVRALSRGQAPNLRALARVMSLPQAQKGTAFEHFFARAIQEFGIVEVGINAELIGSEGNAFMEVDVLANHTGRLYLFDLKSGSNTSLSHQIKEAVSTRDALGGANAVATVVRPEMVVQPFQRKILKTMRAHAVDREAMRSLFAGLAEILDVKTSGKMKHWDEMLHRSIPHWRPGMKVGSSSKHTKKKRHHG